MPSGVAATNSNAVCEALKWGGRAEQRHELKHFKIINPVWCAGSGCISYEVARQIEDLQSKADFA